MKLNNKIKTVFFGTHDFATTILQGLINSPLIDVELVVTQPDRPVGRKKEMQAPPVKILAEKYNIEVNQPEKLKNWDINKISNLDIGITAQYGLIIPKKVLDAPKKGILNVHTSLLPKYRGASPIQTSLINGDTETGVTIMQMDVGMDTGDLLLQKSIQIDPDDTYLDLDKKLAHIGSEALLETLPDYISGELQPISQDDSKATLCKQLSREDGQINCEKKASEIYNQYRGMTPWPGIWTTINNKRLKLLKIKPSENTSPAGQLSIKDDKIYIGCNSGSLEIIELQLEGKKKMNADTFINGYGAKI
jgi:methionyl-tRNA formyltransferase